MHHSPDTGFRRRLLGKGCSVPRGSVVHRLQRQGKVEPREQVVGRNSDQVSAHASGDVHQGDPKIIRVFAEA